LVYHQAELHVGIAKKCEDIIIHTVRVNDGFLGVRNMKTTTMTTTTKKKHEEEKEEGEEDDDEEDRRRNRKNQFHIAYCIAGLHSNLALGRRPQHVGVRLVAHLYRVRRLLK
jgi:hypothetical protein